MVMFTFSLAERLDGVTVNAVEPAGEGVRATVRAVADPALAGVSGRYFKGLSEARADEQAYDPDARERLWTLSEQLTN
jgi:NAD(P)-dependent dehydrogenase (short-subunit alcohol dehydrogenase family)